MKLISAVLVSTVYEGAIVASVFMMSLRFQEPDRKRLYQFVLPGAGRDSANSGGVGAVGDTHS